MCCNCVSFLSCVSLDPCLSPECIPTSFPPPPWCCSLLVFLSVWLVFASDSVHAFPRIQPLPPHVVCVACLSNSSRSRSIGKCMMRSECAKEAKARIKDNGYAHTCTLAARLHTCIPALCLSTPISFSHNWSLLFFLFDIEWISTLVSLDSLSICCLPQSACHQCKQRQQVLFVVSACCVCECCPHAVIVVRTLHTLRYADFHVSE